MELINSSIIAIKLSEFHIIREHSVGLRGIIGDNIYNLMDNPLHVFSVLHQLVQSISGIILSISSKALLNLFLKQDNRNLRPWDSIPSTREK